VISFMPIIFIFYLMVALIETRGYLARAAFLMDGFMHCRAEVVPSCCKISAFGCNGAAIMAPG